MRADFSLPPKERAVYGATITAKSLTSDQTITLVRTGVTALEATRQIAGALDAMDDDFRVVSVSTPVSIERDLFANRIQLAGDSAGSIGPTPERNTLAKIGRLDLLHPALDPMSKQNGRSRSPVKHRKR
jgi:hypothetical protein